MAADRGRTLPKFGEWDVNNPASAEGFTVIFSKARDEKKTSGTSNGANAATARRTNSSAYQKKNDQKMKPPPNKLAVLGLNQNHKAFMQKGSRTDMEKGMFDGSALAPILS